MKEDRLSNIAIINSNKNEIESCETYLKLFIRVSNRKVDFFSSRRSLYFENLRGQIYYNSFSIKISNDKASMS